MDLSIVIPALNEAKKIGRDLEAAAEFLLSEGLTGEVIVVDDGSTDGTATVAGSAPLVEGVSRTVIRCGRRRGKGYAVRAGMRSTQGEYVMFADSGQCIPFKNMLAGLQLIRSGQCDLAHGSRNLAASILVRPKAISRRILSAAFRAVFAPAMGFPRGITDSQCGFKIYRGVVARELYSECSTDGFMFDAEIILRAHKRGCKIREFPVEWTVDPDTRLRPLKEIAGALRDLWRIRRASDASFKRRQSTSS